MSLRSSVNNAVSGVGSNIDAALNSASTFLDNLAGRTTTAVGHMFDGGFVGMCESGMGDIKTAINKYCDGIEEIIKGFDETGDITVAFQGKSQAAAQDFIRAIKDFLAAYATQMKEDIREAEDAYKAFEAADIDTAKSVKSDADDIRAEAAKIRID